MSKLKYCAVGDYGVEFSADNVDAVSDWIHKQEIENEDLQDYYSVKTYTQAEFEALTED